MDINGISGNTVATQHAALTPTIPEAVTTPAASKPEATQPKHDTVELTGTALAKSLKLAGQTPAQIALKMGLDVKTVDSYLGVKPATTTPTPQVKQVVANTVAKPQPYSPAEEVKEPAGQKATETAQGKK